MYTYRHEGLPLTHCPNCGTDLTCPGNVELEVSVNEQNMTFDTHLNEKGVLVDVDNLVRNGYHSRTICAGCSVPLIDTEGVEER